MGWLGKKINHFPRIGFFFRLVGLHRIMNKSETDNDIKTNIKTLSRGLMQADYSVAFRGYKNLYEIDPPAIPQLKEIILGVDWSKSKFKELSRYVAGVFSLIHDIDKAEASHIQRAGTRGRS